jgi:regulator of nonsense transcripts 2
VIPTSSALAAHTLSAQIQSKQEQEQLKRLVLDYEQREEIAELKGGPVWLCTTASMLNASF